MGDVIDLVFMQADRFDEVHLNFVTGRNPTQERRAVLAHLLRDREHGRNIVAGM